jgi:hypothetical protein
VTPERSKAYGRLMRTISAGGSGQLEPDERDLLREAADSLFFCEDLSGDAEAREALTRAGDLAGHLVGSGRWGPERAERLLADLEGCGPAQLVRLAER